MAEMQTLMAYLKSFLNRYHSSVALYITNMVYPIGSGASLISAKFFLRRGTVEGLLKKMNIFQNNPVRHKCNLLMFT